MGISPANLKGVERADEALFQPPSLTGADVYLRIVTGADYAFLHLVEVSEGLGPRWRFRGATPTPEQWASANANNLAQYIIRRVSDHTPLGLVSIYQPNFQDGYVYLAAARFETDRLSPAMIFGVALFIEYVFATWPFRKLYLDLPEFNLSQFASGLGRLFAIEGRLSEHFFADGRYWDQLILAMSRSSWRTSGSRLVRAARGAG